ncbi:hypothetical protein FRB94_006840 [Tulasnella sp. JGI-2019a]|nr:hypothetical protein FRB93_005050 [Tulasnella sp. JGI-2019a]KAG8998539.1 hypothetical protein FRB94_006840 [Tulasnella sp. JGI-2019a]KAG9031069.1 hypothetical protein FRB95_003180 [Tulasnella sp. JGI-2019a]
MRINLPGSRSRADTLTNPQNRLYLLTDSVNFEVPQDVQATIWKIYPTRRQVERVIRSVTSELREVDECTVWFSCIGRNSNVPALRLADPLEIVTGPVSSLDGRSEDTINVQPYKSRS